MDQSACGKTVVFVIWTHSPTGCKVDTGRAELYGELVAFVRNGKGADIIVVAGDHRDTLGK